MDDWLRNMGDWNISRKQYFGLPLPLYPCECGRLNVIGSRAGLEERATGGLDQLQSCTGRGSTVPIRCDECGEEVLTHSRGRRRLAATTSSPGAGLGEPEVEGERVRNGLITQGLSGADLPDHAYWETWFPADWVSEMREQIRL